MTYHVQFLRNVLHEDDPSILVAGSSLISRSSSLWKGHAQGQPMDQKGVRAQTVIASTHQHPDGTMTEVLRRTAEQGWPVYEWLLSPSEASNVHSTASGSMARPSAVGSWRSNSVRHIWAVISERFRCTCAGESQPCGS